MKDLSNENIIHVKKDGIQYLQFRKLLEYQKYVKHAYSLGIDITFRTNRAKEKSLAEKEREKAINSYKKLCSALDEDYIKIIKPRQEHTDIVKVAEKKINKDKPDINISEYEKTDGLITDKKNIILSTTSADCISLLFFDPVKMVISNVHSGWKGTVQRISIKTVDKMVENFNCNPKDIICCICPSIRKDHFKVKEDVKIIFEENFKDLNIKTDKDIMEKLPTEEDTWVIDTVLINKIILLKRGLKSENIIDSNLCTVCNSDILHSYRAEKENYGLNTALIELV